MEWFLLRDRLLLKSLQLNNWSLNSQSESSPQPMERVCECWSSAPVIKNIAALVLVVIWMPRWLGDFDALFGFWFVTGENLGSNIVNTEGSLYWIGNKNIFFMLLEYCLVLPGIRHIWGYNLITMRSSSTPNSFWVEILLCHKFPRTRIGLFWISLILIHLREDVAKHNRLTTFGNLGFSALGILDSHISHEMMSWMVSAWDHMNYTFRVYRCHLFLVEKDWAPMTVYTKETSPGMGWSVAKRENNRIS